MTTLLRKCKAWVFSLQGKFILVASFCIFIFSLIGSFIIISREESLYRKDMVNQCKVIAEISRVTLTNVMVFNELGMMDKLDLIDYLDYFIMNLMDRDKRVRYVIVLDDNGGVLAHSNISEYNKTYKDESLWKAALHLNETEIVDSSLQGESIHKVTTPLNIGTKRWGIIQIGLSMEDMHKSIDALKREVIRLVIIFSSISLLIISIGAEVLAKPVTRLSHIMDGIKNHGDLKQYAFELKDRRDELGKLQKSFLWMIQRLRDADSERKKTMEVLSQTEKMVSVGRLASGVAHEINNPLGGITVCFKNLMKSGMDDVTKEEHIELINDCLQKIKNIVEQLLNFSKMTVTEKTPTDLNGLLDRLLLLLNYATAEKRITVVKDFGEYMQKILIDEGKMGQVFMNIIINAIQAMDNGGVLTIKTGQGNGFYEIFVKDTGAGIPPDIISNIFDPFFTTKSVGVGTGLGLSVSKSIVEQHGGTIEVKSELGAGTIFKIKLPME